MNDEKKRCKEETNAMETERSLPLGGLVSSAERVARLFFQRMKLLFIDEEMTRAQDVLPEIDDALWYLWEDERDYFKRVELGLGERPFFRPEVLQFLANIRRWFSGSKKGHNK